MDYSYSSGRSQNWLMLQLKHEAEFKENLFVAVTDYSYRF